jgi:hypothetical protein
MRQVSASPRRNAHQPAPCLTAEREDRLALSASAARFADVFEQFGAVMAHWEREAAA